MVDVVYAIIIWRAFTLLPRPTAEQLSWEQIGAFLSTNIGSFVSVIIGIVIAIIYWIQNNVRLGNLQIAREFQKEGIKFAFPTSTTYLSQADGQPLSVNLGGNLSVDRERV
jgi:hypothetical protein